MATNYLLPELSSKLLREIDVKGADSAAGEGKSLDYARDSIACAGSPFFDMNRVRLTHDLQREIARLKAMPENQMTVRNDLLFGETPEYCAFTLSWGLSAGYPT
jgi:hypothetical protein